MIRTFGELTALNSCCHWDKGDKLMQQEFRHASVPLFLEIIELSFTFFGQVQSSY